MDVPSKGSDRDHRAREQPLDICILTLHPSLVLFKTMFSRSPRTVVLVVTFWFTATLVSTQVTTNPFQDSVTDYAPSVNVQCPDLSTTQFIREFTPQNQTLHPQEAEYIKTRATTVLPDAWKAWLGDGSKLGYNLSQFEGNFPLIGLAIPGGGLRAAQYGAGCLSGLDARNETAKAAGTGGLLQVASYITGLSGMMNACPSSFLFDLIVLGGSWVTGSLFFNNWPTIQDLVFGDGKDLSGWLLDIPFVTPDGINLFSDKNQAFFGSVLWSVISKAAAGMSVSPLPPYTCISLTITTVILA